MLRSHFTTVSFKSLLLNRHLNSLTSLTFKLQERSLVQLSPCTNYVLRRMLKEHVDSVSVIQSCVLTVSETINLNTLLARLYPRRFEMRSKMHHLEQLTELYQQVSGNQASKKLIQDEIRRRIFQILRIRFGVHEVAMPTIIHCDDVLPFRFFRDGMVWDGLAYQNRFYGKLDEAVPGNCAQLYQLALVLSEQELPYLMTASSESYALWVTLRSPTYQLFLKEGIAPLQKVLSLHSILCRCKQAKF